MAISHIYTLSLHDALPIFALAPRRTSSRASWSWSEGRSASPRPGTSSCSEAPRSEEHTSELQSLRHLVCRLLLEKKKRIIPTSCCWLTILGLALIDVSRAG